MATPGLARAGLLQQGVALGSLGQPGLKVSDDLRWALLAGALLCLWLATGGNAMAAAFANYFVPLQIGARDVAFPRINAFGFWCFLAILTP